MSVSCYQPDVPRCPVPTRHPRHPPALTTGTFELLEERQGDGAAIDKGGEVAERDGATLRLKEGGAFYAPSPLRCVAVHWPRLVAGAQSGELYHLEVEGGA